MHVHGSQRQSERPLFGPQHEPPVMYADFRYVVIAGPAQVRCKQNAGSKRLIALECDLNQDHVAFRFRNDALGEYESWMRMHDRDRGHPRKRIRQYSPRSA